MCSYHSVNKKEWYQCLNTLPNNQLHAETIMRHAPFVAQHYKCARSLSAWIQLLQKMWAGKKSKWSRNTALQMNNSVRKFSAMDPCRFTKSSGKPFRSIANRHLALSTRRTGTKEDNVGKLYRKCEAGFCMILLIPRQNHTVQ